MSLASDTPFTMPVVPANSTGSNGGNGGFGSWGDGNFFIIILSLTA